MTERFYTSVEQIGDLILVRGYDKDRPIKERIPFKPTLYYPSSTETEYQDLEGNYLVARKYDSISAMRESVKTMQGVYGHKFYGSENIIRQFLAEYYPGELSWSTNTAQLWFLDIETTVGETEGSKGFPTPELALEKIQLITIQNYNTKKSYIFSIKPVVEQNPVIKAGSDFRSFFTEEEMLKDFLWFFRNNQIDILSGWNSEFFDIPYIVNRCTRIVGENTTKLLSPWGMIKKRNVKVMDKQKTCFDIVGICHLDYLELYRKFNPGSQESFKLDYIADLELGCGKVDNPFDTFKEFYTGGGDVFESPDEDSHILQKMRFVRTSLAEKCKESPEDAGLKLKYEELDSRIRNSAWNLFVEYNHRDVTLLSDLEDKMRLVELAMMIAYMAKVNVADVHSSMRVWESVIYNHFRDSNTFLQANAPKNMHRSIPGAYVMNVTPGRYRWVVSLDFTSLYPSIMMMNNISPDTKVGKLDVTPEEILAGNIPKFDKERYILSANGVLTRKDKEGYISFLVRQKFDQRKAFKKKMLEYEKEAQEIRDMLKTHPTNSKELSERLSFLEPQVRSLDVKQKAVKVLANAFYGITANEHFFAYDPDLAEAITLTGQLALRSSARIIDAAMNRICGTTGIKYVYYGDTDSVDGSTKIWINGEEIEIAKFYDSISKEEIITDTGNHIKKISGYVTKTLENDTVVDKNVPHIMKHRVKKRMYKILHNGNSVIVTEDHSVMVRRDGNVISCKPADMLPSDYVISLNTETLTPREEITKEKYAGEAM